LERRALQVRGRDPKRRKGAIGLSAAVSYLRSLGMSWVRSHEVELTAYALSLLDREAGVAVYGPREEDRRGGVISFNVSGVHAHDVAQILDSEGVTIRSGHHCAMPVMERYRHTGGRKG